MEMLSHVNHRLSVVSLLFAVCCLQFSVSFAAEPSKTKSEMVKKERQLESLKRKLVEKKKGLEYNIKKEYSILEGLEEIDKVLSKKEEDIANIENSLIQLKEKTCLIKEIQHSPVSDEITHVDLTVISLNETIHVKVHVVALDVEISVGIKKGGVLDIVHHEIEVECLPTEIPEKITNTAICNIIPFWYANIARTPKTSCTIAYISDTFQWGIPSSLLIY